MNNNDVIRRIRYTFNYSNPEILHIFKNVGAKATLEQLDGWLYKDEDPEQVVMVDIDLSNFLNGFIIEKRGQKGDEIPKPEKRLNNNIILRKLKIALNLKDTEMIAIFKLADLDVGKSELAALFRKPESEKFVRCKDQFLRNFMQGIQLNYRPEKNK